MERMNWSAGPHRLEFEPPDLFHCHVRGTVLASEVKEAFRIMREEVIPKVGDVYFLLHLTKWGADAIPMETRKYLDTTDPPWRGEVVIGGSSITRMAASIALRTIMVLSGKRLLMKVVGTDEEALACINEWRSRSTGVPAAKP
jgi:hypothetical protein